MKKKSAAYVEDIRRSLLDVSDAANKMAGTPSPAAAPRPPRKPPQKKQ
jgi:phospholipid/cholesterol/gamma-HCH transport system substrate-binding protein